MVIYSVYTSSHWIATEFRKVPKFVGWQLVCILNHINTHSIRPFTEHAGKTRALHFLRKTLIIAIDATVGAARDNNIKWQLHVNSWAHNMIVISQTRLCDVNDSPRLLWNCQSNEFVASRNSCSYFKIRKSKFEF